MRMAVLLLACVQLLLLSKSVYPYVSEGNGDIILGGLFPVHNNIDGSCGRILDLGVQRLEAMVLAVDMINDDPMLLPGLKLGYDIRDTCTRPSIALQSSLDFIVGLETQDSVASNATSVGTSGVVGSASSSESISAASLLRLFQTPQISYASTASILSDKTRFEYFFRTLPPDDFQAKVMVELVLKFNWTYVIPVSSDDVYGNEGIQVFIDELNNVDMDANTTLNNSFCVIGNPISISVTASDEEYDNAVQQINKPWVANSSVVILFGQLATAEGLLKAVARYPNHRPLTFIVSDAVGDNLDSKFYSTYHTMINILPEYNESQQFNAYFTALKPNNTANPWFTEYWESVFNCSFNMSQNVIDHCNESAQSLSESSYEQNSKVPFVLDAVYAFAHAIHNMLTSVCGSITVCDQVRVERYGKYLLNGEILLQYLHNVSFNGFSAKTIDFDEKGDQAGGYWINNLQYNSGDFEFVRIAVWSRDTSLVRTSNSVYWGFNASAAPISKCADPCSRGYHPITVSGEASCCWTCEQCQGVREISNGLECFECEQGFSPNLNKSECIENPLNYLMWEDGISVFIMLFSIFGLLCTSVVAGVYIIFYNHENIKASSRELTAIILTGLFLCFLIPFFSIGEPTAPTCGISRFLFGFSFCLCYAALLVKTNRIHRIFNRDANSSQRPPLISSKIQILFTSMLVGVQVVISGAWLIIEIPGIKIEYRDKTTELSCRATPFVGIIVSLVYNLLLLIATAYFAFRTRKIPQKFNEAVWINVTLYSVLVVWACFIPVYIVVSAVLGSQTTSQSVSQLFAIVLSAFSTLGILFFSKLYYMYSAKRKQSKSIMNSYYCYNEYSGTSLIRTL